jgi:hypothetical protein
MPEAPGRVKLTLSPKMLETYRLEKVKRLESRSIGNIGGGMDNKITTVAAIL